MAADYVTDIEIEGNPKEQAIARKAFEKYERNKAAVWFSFPNFVRKYRRLNINALGPWGKYDSLMDISVFDDMIFECPNIRMSVKIDGNTAYSDEQFEYKYSNGIAEGFFSHKDTDETDAKFAEHYKSRLSPKEFTKLFGGDEKSYDALISSLVFKDTAMQDLSCDEFCRVTGISIEPNVYYLVINGISMPTYFEFIDGYSNELGTVIGFSYDARLNYVLNNMTGYILVRGESEAMQNVISKYRNDIEHILVIDGHLIQVDIDNISKSQITKLMDEYPELIMLIEFSRDGQSMGCTAKGNRYCQSANISKTINYKYWEEKATWTLI